MRSNDFFNHGPIFHFQGFLFLILWETFWSSQLVESKRISRVFRVFIKQNTVLFDEPTDLHKKVEPILFFLFFSSGSMSIHHIQTNLLSYQNNKKKEDDLDTDRQNPSDKFLMMHYRMCCISSYYISILIIWYDSIQFNSNFKFWRYLC